MQVGALAQSAPQPASRNGVTYVTGGVGEDEEAVFRSAAGRYNLRMTFTSKAGNYLSDVDVTVTAKLGRPVAPARTEGPFLFVQSPPGAYQSAAKANQVAQARKIVVASRGHRCASADERSTDFGGVASRQRSASRA
jgi:hypothetical protein